MNKQNLYDYLIKLQAITKIGLKYSTDPFAVENYKQIEKLTFEMLTNLQSVNLKQNNFFKRDIYPTPNISVRTLVFNEKDEFLMVREVSDNGYSLPGGWCDLYDAPSEAAIREVKEEAGADVTITNLVAIINRTPYKDEVSVPEYVVVFKAILIKIEAVHDHEISDVAWFTLETLPTLSTKVTPHEIMRMVTAAFNNEVIFD